jgi:Mn2+/Fe2+ NRAMP family transporter
MGEYVNPRSYNIISWGTVAVLAGLAIFFVITTFVPRSLIW